MPWGTVLLGNSLPPKPTLSLRVSAYSEMLVWVQAHGRASGLGSSPAKPATFHFFLLLLFGPIKTKSIWSFLLCLKRKPRVYQGISYNLLHNVRMSQQPGIANVIFYKVWVKLLWDLPKDPGHEWSALEMAKAEQEPEESGSWPRTLHHPRPSLSYLGCDLCPRASPISCQ